MPIQDDPFEDSEGLDLTSEPPTLEPASFKGNAAPTNTTSSGAGNKLTHVQVHFRCCKVYWRFPIPADVLSGAKECWFVYCPRCGSKLQLP